MLWWLAQNALGATILAGAVALLTRFVRMRPAVAHVLWLLVLLKLLAPPLLVWPWPGVPLEPATPMASIANDTPRLVLRNTPPLPTEATTSRMPAAVPVERHRGHWLKRAQAAGSGEAIQKILTQTWLFGAVIMAALQLAWLVRLRLSLRKGVAPPSRLLDELRDLAAQLEVTPPRTVVLPTGSPLLVGGMRPTLVLPASLLDQLDAAGWRSVLAHELIHLKRRDHWTGWLELAAAGVWWWNPVFWYARRRLRESAEYACDAWVVRLLPENRRAYAESLITVVASLTRHPLPVASIGMAAHGKRIFERRLEMILREAVPHRLSRLAVTGAALAALLMLPGWALPTPQRPAELQSVTASNRPLTPVSVQTEEPKQEAAVEVAKVPDSAMPSTLPSTPKREASRTARVSGKPAATTSARVKAAPELPGPGTPTASTPSPRQLAELQNVSVGSEMQVRSEYPNKPKPIDLEQDCSIQFENQHVSAIVDYMTEFYGYNFVIDPRVVAPRPRTVQPGFPPPPSGVPAPPGFPAPPRGIPGPPAGMKPTVPLHEYATDGMVSIVKLEKVPLGEALKVLLLPLNLGYRVVGSVIFISTPENLAKADPKPPALGPDQEAIAKKLNAETSIEFEEYPLPRVLNYLHEYFKVDVEIDPEAKLPDTDRPATEAVVSYLRLEKVPLWEALYWVTSNQDLTYTVSGETVWITTPDRVSEVGG